MANEKNQISKDISVENLNKHFATKMVEHLGIEYTSVGADYLSGKMPVDHRTQQPLGILHGGASVVLAETLGSVAANLVLNDPSRVAVGLEINANHVKSVTSGYVYGKATAIHLGKNTQIWDIRINNEEEKLVCTSRLTMAVIDRKI